MIAARSVVAAGLTLGLVAAAPSGPVASPTALVTRYVGAIAQNRYPQAFASLVTTERRYFRSPENFASVFAADDFHIDRYRVVSMRRRASGFVVLVREHLRFRDQAANQERSADANAVYGVERDGGDWRISDPGHPWRAFAAEAVASDGGVRLTVRKMSFFPRRVEVALTFANVGDRFVTILPYGRTVLKDDRGAAFRPLRTRDWRLTSRRLFEGLRLAPDAQFTSIMNFETPVLDDTRRTYSLTVEPELRDGGDAPFSTTVGPIAGEAKSGQRSWPKRNAARVANPHPVYHGIYALIDPSTNDDPRSFAAEVLAGGVRLLQLRAKSGVDRRLLADLVGLAHASGARLVVNDDVDAGLAADGVHLGIEDCASLDLAALRRALGGRTLGLSAATPDEARVAREAGADYVGAGPIFATATKADAGAPIGISGVRAVVGATSLPVAAIGGITLEAIGRVRESGAAMAAIVSALAGASAPRAYAHALVSRWGGR